jgi:hypothetical protein
VGLELENKTAAALCQLHHTLQQYPSSAGAHVDIAHHSLVASNGFFGCSAVRRF